MNNRNVIGAAASRLAVGRLCVVMIVMALAAIGHPSPTRASAPEPAAESPGPTLAAALENYKLEGDQWQKQSRVDPSSPEGQLHAIRQTIAEQKFEDADDAATAWIEAHPNHPQIVEAYLLRGDAKVGEGEEYKALSDYEYVIRSYPASEQFEIALDREYEIARLYAAGRKRRFLGIRMLPAGDEAEEIFIRIQERSPGSSLGEKASLELGDFYYNTGEMTKAADAFSLFLINYPRTRYRQRAMLRVIQADLARFKGPNFDATGLIDAAGGDRPLAEDNQNPAPPHAGVGEAAKIDRSKLPEVTVTIPQFKKEFPAEAERIGADALMVRIDESLGLKMLFTGNWYRGQGRTLSAITMYRRVVRDHPRTAAARAAVVELTKLGATVVESPARRDTALRGAATRQALPSRTDAVPPPAPENEPEDRP